MGNIFYSDSKIQVLSKENTYCIVLNLNRVGCAICHFAIIHYGYYDLLSCLRHNSYGKEKINQHQHRDKDKDRSQAKTLNKIKENLVDYKSETPIPGMVNSSHKLLFFRQKQFPEKIISIHFSYNV